MSFSQRLFLACAIVILDMVFFMLPLAALFCAYILLSRPEWFQEWVHKSLYAGE